MVLAFGYYIEKMSGLPSFTPADINACYYEAKLETSNTSQMIIQNIRNSRMMPAKKGTSKGKKAYTLTQTGEDFIEKKLNKPAK
jgi:predicted transcriptional regulator